MDQSKNAAYLTERAKDKVLVFAVFQSLSLVQLFVTPWTEAHQGTNPMNSMKRQK